MVIGVPFDEKERQFKCIVTICNPNNGRTIECTALFDTGARSSALIASQIDELQLEHLYTGTHITMPNTGTYITKHYNATITIADGITFENTTINSLPTIYKDLECLIGMDIISQLNVSIAQHEDGLFMFIEYPPISQISFL